MVTGVTRVLQAETENTVLVLLAGWLARVYVRREFESRSRHKVCPLCLGGAAVVLLCATASESSCSEESQ